MTEDTVAEWLARFHRHMRAAAVLRWAFVVVMITGCVAFYQVGPTAQLGVLAVMGLATVAWVVLGVRGVRLAGAARLGAMLLEAGRIDEAQQHLARALRAVTPLRSVKLLACHQMAVAAHASRCYRGAVALCRALLGERLGAMKSMANATRLILADSLLMLDDVRAAGLALDGLSGARLSLADRMVLLPIELRYHLAAGLEDRAVESLPHKVRLAELLDAPDAALAHALLAEACRRNQLTPQGDYLRERAALLGDLDAIVAGHPALLGGLGSPPAGTEPPTPTEG